LHEPTPEQVTVHAHAFEQLVVLLQLPPPLHVTVQRPLPHSIAFEQESVPAHSTVHSEAFPQCTPALQESSAMHFTSHGIPAGHSTVFEQALPPSHVNTHVPLVHVPPAFVHAVPQVLVGASMGRASIMPTSTAAPSTAPPSLPAIVGGTLPCSNEHATRSTTQTRCTAPCYAPSRVSGWWVCCRHAPVKFS
jgi:hypothetical protein